MCGKLLHSLLLTVTALRHVQVSIFTCFARAQSTNILRDPTKTTSVLSCQFRHSSATPPRHVALLLNERTISSRDDHSRAPRAHTALAKSDGSRRALSPGSVRNFVIRLSSLSTTIGTRSFSQREGARSLALSLSNRHALSPTLFFRDCSSRSEPAGQDTMDFRSFT